MSFFFLIWTRNQKYTAIFMLQTLNLSVPTSWQSLSERQLRYVYRLFSLNYSLAQVMALCLLKWADIKVICKEGALFIISHKGHRYNVSALQITEASQALEWLGSVPDFPVRLSVIRGHHAVRADFQEVSFGDFISMGNLYQGYLQTQHPALLSEMAVTLYQARKIRLSKEEEISIFYWFAAVKQMFGRMFPHFFKKNEAMELPSTPSFQQLQDAMNTQIRALTGGDITKETTVLQMDCWRALTELDAKARDYEEMKKASHS